jgi:oligopeptide/dipeptide ABC transporter ATP-binding protein
VLKVGYQIEEVINTHLAVSKREAAHMAVALLRELNIPSPEQRVKEYPHQLSGGMRQRVMMAMAIACSPTLLIADEPTTALDVTIEAQLLKLIRTMRDNKGMSVLLITHDLGIIAENAETVAIMYAGRLVEQAPVAELFNAPMHPYTQGLLGSVPAARGTKLTPVRGMVPKPWELPSGCTFSDRCDFVIDACGRAEPEFIEVGASHRSRCIRTAEAPWRVKV